MYRIFSTDRHFIRTARKTFVRQRGEHDCGAACVRSIVQYYGGKYKEDEVRALAGSSANGISFTDLMNALKAMDFDCEAFEADTESLEEVDVPTILHVETKRGRGHFSLCYGKKGKRFLIGDPAKGIISSSREHLEASWKSRALIIPRTQPGFKTYESVSTLKQLKTLLGPDAGILIAIMMLSMVIAVCGISGAMFLKATVDEYLPEREIEKMLTVALLLLIILLFKAGAMALKNMLLLKHGKGLAGMTGGAFMKTVYAKPYMRFNASNAADINVRFNKVLSLQKAIGFLFGTLLADACVFMCSLAAILYYSPATFTVLVPAIILIAGFSYKTSPRIRNMQKHALQSIAEAEEIFMDHIRGIKAVKTSSNPGFFVQSSLGKFGKRLSRETELGKLVNRYGAVNECLGAVVFSCIIFGGCLLFKEDEILAGEFVATLTVSGLMMPSLGRLAQYPFLAEDIKLSLSMLEDIEDDGAIKDVVPVSGSGCRLEFRKVSFGYKTDKLVLSDLSFEVNKGEILLIYGDCGAGKSTISDLAKGLNKPNSGAILLNGHLLTDHGSIGTMPQSPHIFSASLKENVTAGCRGEEFEDFCRYYGFDTYFECLPAGYDTVLGQDGHRLSVGYQQLVCFARAIYKLPRVLILDEPTAAMDPEMKRLVYRILLMLREDVAIVVMGHDRESLAIADRRVRVGGG